MKLIICLAVFCSFSAFAKTPTNFNEALLDDVKKEVRKDDEKFKTPASRSPASVETKHEHVIEEIPKIDKNLRQIGPNKW